jgi:glycosyltransferase involved in cell wall biosynthesis
LRQVAFVPGEQPSNPEATPPGGRAQNKNQMKPDYKFMRIKDLTQPIKTSLPYKPETHVMRSLSTRSADVFQTLRPNRDTNRLRADNGIPLRAIDRSFARMLEVILITYNRASYLDTTLERLKNSPISQCKITVIDNASNDATPEVCAKHAPAFPQFCALRNRFNVGISGNYLRALETTRSEYTWVICDDDDFNFSRFDEVIEAVTSRKYDIISLGVPNHTELPRGVGIRSRELIQDRSSNFFYASSFIPCTILRSSLLNADAMLQGYHHIHTLFSNLFFFVSAVRQDALVYITRNDFVINRQENVGYRPLHLVTGWMQVANDIKPQDPAIAKAMMCELLGNHFYPRKIAQYTLFQRGFSDQNTRSDAFKIAINAFRAGPLWFLKVLPFLIVLFLPAFVSRSLWRGAEKVVEKKEKRKLKRPVNIEFGAGLCYRG